MRILRFIHTAYGMLIFMILFVIFFIPLLVPIFFPSRHAWVGVVNRVWAKILFSIVFLPARVIVKQPLSSRQQYIFCPNHFSYLDIPVMGLNPTNSIFVGKNDMESIPLFGFMYRRLHITVDRSKLRSKYETYVKSGKALDEGKSLVIFPEGGIFCTHPPAMTRFKDGAFRLAIEKQIPIVPVTIPDNWIILPPDEFLLNPGSLRVIFHEPVETRNLTMNDLPELKSKVFTVIDEQLKECHADRSGAFGKNSAPQPA